MTKEDRQYINLDEIIAYEFRCKQETCGARITVIAAKGVVIPGNCPQGHDWVKPGMEAVAAHNALQQFLESVPEVERLKRFLGCELYLQLRYPQESQSDMVNKIRS